MKQIEDSTNKLKDIWCSRIGRFNAVKMFILLKAIYRFKIISIKMPSTHRTRTNNTKSCM